MKKNTVLILALTFCSPAFAYLDPGSGSAIMSAIIGVVVAVGMAIKTYWYKIKALFTRKKNPTLEKNDQE